MSNTERVKAIYQHGTLHLLEPFALPEGAEVWVELLVSPLAAERASVRPFALHGPAYPVHPQSPETLARLVGLVAVGGDALADSEALYDADWN